MSSADDRIDLILFGPFIEVAAELGQVAALFISGRLTAGCVTVVHELAQALGHEVGIDIHIFEDLDSHARSFGQDAEQEVFGSDVVLFQPIGFTDSHFHDPFGTRRQAQFSRRIGPPTDLLFNGTGNIL